MDPGRQLLLDEMQALAGADLASLLPLLEKKRQWLDSLRGTEALAGDSLLELWRANRQILKACRQVCPASLHSGYRGRP